jgi:hypothetical protein
MQVVDTRVVNRSNALQGFHYGKDYVFIERTKSSNLFNSIFYSLLMPLIAIFLLVPFARSLLKKVLPQPGCIYH